MKFFFDNCVSQRIVKAIACIENLPERPTNGSAELELEHLLERWPGGADDIDWIPLIAKEQQTIITTDHAQRKTRGRTQAEAKALREYGAIGFYLPKLFSGATRWDQVWKFFKYWPVIKEESADRKSR